jgi:DNA-binding response OmpR family regulator
MMNTKILLVDDDVELVLMLKEYLEQEGFCAEVLHQGEPGVLAALSGEYALLVLDVMMPGMSGVEVLRRVRQHSALPVLMLTAKGDDVDRIVGLELGADDYVPKPCTPRELVARIRAILRRTEHVTTPEVLQVSVGPLTIKLAQRVAEWDGVVMDLTSTELTLLSVLARQAGQVVSKNQLSEQGLGRPLARFDRSIDVHISSIRQKIALHAGERTWIATVRGSGYQLIRE